MLNIRRLAILTFILFCTAYFIIYYYDNFHPLHFRNITLAPVTLRNHTDISNQFEYDSHVLYTEGCKVPKFDPFDPSVLEYYKVVSGIIPCHGNKYISVIDNKAIVDEVAVKKDFNGKNFTCTYKAIYRNPKNKTSKADDQFGYGNESPLIFNDTLPYEFVKAICRAGDSVTYEEFLASTPIKPSVEERCTENAFKVLSSNNLNVIVVGIDSISKLNFERHFNLTAKYLRQNLSLFEFHGYMKVGDNTFPNLTPILTGHFIKHYWSKANRYRYFDDLDFIWKNFSSIGYRTFYAEDAPDMGTYNYLKSGFQFPPTDYFFRPFTLAIEDSPWQKASKADCFQAKPEIVALYDYLRSFLNTMKHRPFFAFTWAARLTHGTLNNAGYADKPTYELLRDIKDMGLLNSSMLIFMSDHGIRFGGIRKTFIGKIEERMPFLFISFPGWFLETYKELNSNLIANQGRLTTPFDIHETLVDIFQMTSKDYSLIRTPYGISLFDEISPHRDCKSAFILPHWCVCHNYAKLSLDSDMALAAAGALVAAVNSITLENRKHCEELKLDLILDARVTQPEDDLLRYNELESGDDESSITFGKNSDSYEKLLITVRTLPGEAEFESTLHKIKTSYKVYDVSRINMYRNQGDCVDDPEMRKYCFCKLKLRPLP